MTFPLPIFPDSIAFRSMYEKRQEMIEGELAEVAARNQAGFAGRHGLPSADRASEPPARSAKAVRAVETEGGDVVEKTA